MYSLLFVIIYLAFISLGLPDSLLGSAWPTMYIELNAQLSNMGIVSMIISFGTIVSSLFSDRLTKKLGTWLVTTISIFLTAFGLFGFSFSSQLYMLCLFAIPYGLGAGAIDASLNNYVALHYSSKHMSWLHCFWGVGTIISPYVMGFSLSTNLSWRGGYRIIGFIQVAIALVLVFSWRLWKKNQDSYEESSSVSLSFRELFHIKGLVSLLFAFLCYCALEQTVMLWASSYMNLHCNIEKEDATFFASLFFIGMTIGRFISGFISEKIGDKKLIRLGYCIVAFSIVLIFLSNFNSVFSLVGFIICGFGCAPIYPSIIHSTPNNFGKENSQAIIGIQMASAYVGSTFMPPFFGIIAQYIDIGLLPVYLTVFLILLIVMIERLNKIVKKR